MQKEPLLPAPFGSVQNPVSVLEREHDVAGNALCALNLPRLIRKGHPSARLRGRSSVKPAAPTLF
jgi:hypothetical protein